MKYQLAPFDELENVQPNQVYKLYDGEPNRVTVIPLDEEGEYQDEYKAWLAAGNTPLPAPSPE